MSIKVDKKLILNKIKDTYGYTKDSDFARFLGIPPTTLSSWFARSTFDIELLYSKCVNINPAFLITGEGEVKISDIKTNGVVIEKTKSKAEVQAENVFKLKTDRSIHHQLVPLYNLEATAGVVALFNDNNSSTPIDFINIPNLPKCDAAVYVTGDSMYPLLKSGDIVMYKQVTDIANDIFWGEMYLIAIDLDGEEHVLVKYIQKSDREGCVRLVSQNKHHQDKDVSLSKIKALALIKASIRINSMM